MIEPYYWPTPNGHKITMFLEEAELEYRIHPVDISAGDQFKPEFLRISPVWPDGADLMSAQRPGLSEGMSPLHGGRANFSFFTNPPHPT